MPGHLLGDPVLLSGSRLGSRHPGKTGNAGVSFHSPLPCSLSWLCSGQDRPQGTFPKGHWTPSRTLRDSDGPGPSLSTPAHEGLFQTELVPSEFHRLKSKPPVSQTGTHWTDALVKWGHGDGALSQHVWRPYKKRGTQRCSHTGGLGPGEKEATCKPRRGAAGGPADTWTSNFRPPQL